MAGEFEYDDSNLQKMFMELEPKRRVQALKGGFRKAATEFKKAAVNNLRSSGIRTDKDLEKGVRALVFRKSAGFRVTVGTRRGKNRSYGFHVNRFGQEKPILMWAESGTKERKKRRSKKRTGRMRRYAFMEQTLAARRESVTNDLHKCVIENIQKVSKKYGCK